MNEFITLLQSVRHFPISEAEKRVLYNIINNTQRDSSNKIKRLKKFLGFTKNKMDGGYQQNRWKQTVWLKKALIHSSNATKDPNPMVVMDQRPTNEKCRLTSIGLIHIFNDKYTYSPEFLIKYHKISFCKKYYLATFKPIQ